MSAGAVVGAILAGAQTLLPEIAETYNAYKRQQVLNQLNRLQDVADRANMSAQEIINKANSILSEIGLSVNAVAPQIKGALRSQKSKLEEKIRTQEKRINSNNSLVSQASNLATATQFRSGIGGAAQNILDEQGGNSNVSKISAFESKIK